MSIIREELGKWVCMCEYGQNTLHVYKKFSNILNTYLSNKKPPATK